MFFESRTVYEIMREKSGKAGQINDNNIIRHVALCMLVEYGYRHTIRLCNFDFYGKSSYENRLNIAMYVHCLPCLLLSSTVTALQNCSFPRLKQSEAKNLQQPIKLPCNTIL